MNAERTTHRDEPTNAQVSGCQRSGCKSVRLASDADVHVTSKAADQFITSLDAAAKVAAHETKKGAKPPKKKKKEGIKWGDQLIDPHQQASRI